METTGAVIATLFHIASAGMVAYGVWWLLSTVRTISETVARIAEGCG
jgi:hypothetical protein